MNKIFSTILLIALSCFAFAQNPAPCSNLFISEYVEGSSFNKAIEIYNPTSSDIDLSKYKIWTSFNGGGNATSVYLTGTLASGSVYVVANDEADSINLAPLADLLSNNIKFNGNDALALIDTVSGDTLDIIGIIGNDPLTGWSNTNGDETVNTTWIRNTNINNGQLDWNLAKDEYTVFPQNDYTHLGSHTMDPCGVILDPIVSFTGNNQSINEGAGDITIDISIINPNANNTDVTVTLMPSTATNGSDFTFSGGQQSITFPAGSSANQSIFIPILENGLIEPTEFFVLKLENPTNNAGINAQFDTIYIIDNDAQMPQPEITFLFPTQEVNESAQLAGVQLEIIAPNGLAASADVSIDLTGTNATANDYTFTNQTVTFPAGSASSQFVSVFITDDTEIESTDTIKLILSNPSSGVSIGFNGSTKIIIIDNDPNGTKQLEQNGINVYPNPVSNSCKVQCNSNVELVNVINTLGQIVQSKSILSEKLFTLDLTSLSQGIYTIQLITNTGVVNHSILKK